MVRLQHVCLPSQNFGASVDFYRSILRLDGVRISACEHAFELGDARLSCIRVGGHEYVQQPTALVLSTEHLPSTTEIERFGGKPRSDGEFPLRLPETPCVFATDPSGNTICFALARRISSRV